jgi:hypothetical protein
MRKAKTNAAVITAMNISLLYHISLLQIINNSIILVCNILISGNYMGDITEATKHF